MLPGLMRTAATPWSIAFNARLALKWMSAMMGTGEKRTIFESASASSVFGTATRTISQPALASAATCAVVASTSCVFVRVIDCTTTGAPPPILTPPTEICRVLAMRAQSNEGRRRPERPRPAGRLAAAEAADVVRQPDEEEHQHERDPDHRDALVDVACHRLPARSLEQREGDVAAVERQQRKQVHQGERERDEREQEQVVLHPLADRG